MPSRHLMVRLFKPCLLFVVVFYSMIALCSKDFNNLNWCFSEENKSHCMDKETFLRRCRKNLHTLWTDVPVSALVIFPQSSLTTQPVTPCAHKYSSAQIWTWISTSWLAWLHIFLVTNAVAIVVLRRSNKSHAPSLGSVGSGGGVGSPGGKKPERRLRSSPRNSEPETHTQGRGTWTHEAVR